MFPTRPTVPTATNKWFNCISGIMGKKSGESPRYERTVRSQTPVPKNPEMKKRITIIKMPSTGPEMALK
jgi:hypothetical protein